MVNVSKPAHRVDGDDTHDNREAWEEDHEIGLREVVFKARLNA